jgi:enterochelin esterase-like enzyme
MVARAVLVVAFLFVVAVVVRHAVAVRTQGARVSHVTLQSRYVSGDRRETLVTPFGGGPGRPLLVFLHGRGSDGEDSNLNNEFFAALRGLGRRAPDVVFPDGADHSYWHDRRDGAWEQYLVREVIPLAVRRLRANPRRIAIGGISMGGWGAYEIATHHPGRFCAVGGHSPAIWRTAGETAPGAFDDADDFARHDLIAAVTRQPHIFGDVPLWLDAGTGDPFDAGDRAFAGALRAAGVRIEVHRWPGSHQSGYWRSHWRSYLRFYAAALARC